MRNNQDGTFLDADGRPHGHADRAATVRPGAVTRVDAAWPTSGGAAQLSEVVGKHAATSKHLEGGR